jgi:hypothetical protein
VVSKSKHGMSSLPLKPFYSEDLRVAAISIVHQTVNSIVVEKRNVRDILTSLFLLVELQLAHVEQVATASSKLSHSWDPLAHCNDSN